MTIIQAIWTSKAAACPTRRAVLVAVAGGVACATPTSSLGADDDAATLIEQLIGRTASQSDRLRLSMPDDFPNGAAVPLTLEVDSPMTQLDHVKEVRVLASRNPIVEVGAFHFTPRHGIARVTTRIRLAEPQYVIAVAEMSDGSLLMNRLWVKVETNGCN
jgi:sulfur-oxidizing protein SoxY